MQFFKVFARLLIALGFFVAPFEAVASDRYLTPTSPFPASITPGTTVHFSAGTYHLTSTIQASGSDAGYVILKADPGVHAVLDGSAIAGPVSAQPAIVSVFGKNVKIIGLDFENSKYVAVSVYGASHVEIGGNRIHDACNAGIYVSGASGSAMEDINIHDNRIYFNARRNRLLTAEATEVSCVKPIPQSNGGWDAGMNITSDCDAPGCKPIAFSQVAVSNNILYNNQGEGLIFKQSSGAAFQNVLHDNFSAQLYLDGAANVDIVGNYIYRTSGSPFLRAGTTNAAIGAANERPEAQLVNPLTNIQLSRNVISKIDSAFNYFLASSESEDKDLSGMHNVVVDRNTSYGSSESAVKIQTRDYSTNAPIQHGQVKFTNNIWNVQSSAALTDLGGAKTGATTLFFKNNCWSRIGDSSNLLQDKTFPADPSPYFGDPKFVLPAQAVPGGLGLQTGSPCLGHASAPIYPVANPFSGIYLIPQGDFFERSRSMPDDLGAMTGIRPQTGSSPYGQFESVDSAGTIRGWGYDPDDSTREIEIDAYIDGPAGSGTLACIAFTNIPRPDLTFPQPGDHGFVCRIDPKFADGRSHTVYAYALDYSGNKSTELSGDLKNFIFKSPIGFLEGVSSSGQVTGWAIDPDAKNKSISVHVYVDGIFSEGGRGIDCGPTSVYRSDINASVGATGNHGFNCQLPASLVPTASNIRYRVYAYGIDATRDANSLLPGSPAHYRKCTTLCGAPKPGSVVPPTSCQYVEKASSCQNVEQ